MLRIGIPQDHQIVGKAHVLQVRVLAAAGDLLGPLQHPIDLVEVEVTEHGRAYTPYKDANTLVEFSTSIPRTQLRPRYGDGFLGAPLQLGTPCDHPTPPGQGDVCGPSRTLSPPTTRDSGHVCT